MSEAIYDLEKLADELTRARRHRELSDHLTDTRHLVSNANDLQKVLVALETMETLQPSHDDLKPSLAQNSQILEAELVYAVMIYSRSTFSSSAGSQRKPWFSTDKLPAKLRETHKLVKHLRDKEIGHFGKGRHVDGAPLLTEVFYLIPGDDAIINFIGLVTATVPAFVKDFKRLVTVVRGEALARVHKRYSKVNELFRAADANDDQFWDLFERCRITDEKVLRRIPQDPRGMTTAQRYTNVEVRWPPAGGSSSG